MEVLITINIFLSPVLINFSIAFVLLDNYIRFDLASVYYTKYKHDQTKKIQQQRRLNNSILNTNKILQKIVNSKTCMFTKILSEQKIYKSIKRLKNYRNPCFCF